MTSKAALKDVKQLIDNGDFVNASKKASALLSKDPKNFTGLLFLGFAQDKLDQFEDAEKTYHTAELIRPSDLQPLKGLITLYERQGRLKLGEYQEAVLRIGVLYAEQDDRDQCQSAVDKYELFAKKHGSQKQYRTALELLLPTSPLYNFLEGRIPRPSHTFSRLLASAEAEEKEWINTQIGERRTRLGAKIAQVTQQVRAEAIEKFQVERLYTELISWTNEDDERHLLEEKHIQRAYDDLLILPRELKPPQRDKVLNIANGMVIVRHASIFGWKIALNWVDAELLIDWDTTIFHAFIETFPDDGLSKVLRGYLAVDESAQQSEAASPTEERADTSTPVGLSEADRLILMTEGIEDCSESLLAHRILADTYLTLNEHESAAESFRKARDLHLGAIRDFGLDLQNSLDAVNVGLATALIYHQSPRHHPEARGLFEAVLEKKPLLTAALLGIGLIDEEDEDYPKAIIFLSRAAERDTSNLRIRLELAWCRALSGALGEGLAEFEPILQTLRDQKDSNPPMLAEVLYRIAYCKWHLEPTAAARKKKDGPYRELISSIKADPNYAPPYTLLGIYFQDYGKSQARARVAFQKAFELSISELEAAHRLAGIFADASEWDLVELVARRVVDSGKARPAPGSKRKAYSWPYAALGVVQMNKQQYSQSIVSFQGALRISPQDYNSWVGLGESYHNSGRYVAASRTFMKAESLEHGLSAEQTCFAKTMLANVQREMGAFDEAAKGYRAVLDIVGTEFGVMVSLLQTLAENARAKLELGMFGQSVDLAEQALRIAKDISALRTDVFNLWKSTADAFSVLAACHAKIDDSKISEYLSVLNVGLDEAEFKLLSDTDRVERATLESTEHSLSDTGPTVYLHAAILASKRSIYASSSDIHAQALAWFNLGWAEYQAFFTLDILQNADDAKSRRYLKASMKCFKRAIELEASNSEYWNALGVVTMTLNPTVSQHAFVRSLHLNERSARTWTNLGALYLLNGGTQLANEAFTRAQSADPEYGSAWVGQGLIALLYGNFKEARGLFTHASENSPANAIAAKKQYSLAAFDHLLKEPGNAVDLLPPLFALRQITLQTPSDLAFGHLEAMFLERTDNFEEASSRLTHIISSMENDPKPKNAARQNQTHADLARSLIALERYPEALSHSATSDNSHEVTSKTVASSDLTSGLAHFHLDDHKEAQILLESALERSENNSPDIACALAQVHWSSGDPASATDLLFASVESHPDHVPSILLLAVIGLLNNDADILEAVEDDLKALRTNEKVTVQEKMQIARVLAGILAAKPSSTTTNGSIDTGTTNADTAVGMDIAALSDATKSIMLDPTQPQGWTELTDLLAITATSTSTSTSADQHTETYPAEMALLTATKQLPPNGQMSAEEYARILAKTGRRKDALWAVVVAPWCREGRDGFSAAVGVVRE